MFEKDAKEFADKYNIMNEDLSPKSPRHIVLEVFKAGAEFGYNKAMKEWRDCFMSCSSPFCADKFRDIQCGGILGNMMKEVRDGSVE